jgi:predicted O-methyltransferase YrrM
MLNIMRQGIFVHLKDFVDEQLVGKKDLVGIEIGSYAGESAEMFLASGAFKKLYCIDPWKDGYDPADTTCGSDFYLAEQAFDSRFKNNPIIEKIKMTSDDAVFQFEDESVDFIYIDGNHLYPYVKTDLSNYVPKVKIGGIISGHDYGGPTTPGVTRAVNEFFKVPPIKTYKDYSWIHIKK